MRERPYRVCFAGRIGETFNIIVPNYFANFNYVKVKVINLGIDVPPDNSTNIGLFCFDHYFDAFYGDGTKFLKNPSEINRFMFNIIPLVNGVKSQYAYLPYRKQYTFYFRDLSAGQIPTELTLILELEPVNFN